MAKISKRSINIKTIAIIILFLVFLINIWIMINRLGDPFTGTNYLNYLASDFSNLYITIYHYFIRIVFYISIVFLLIGIYSIFKIKSKLFNISIIYFLLFDILLIANKLIFDYFTVFTSVLLIINVLLIIVVFILVFFNKIVFKNNEEDKIRNQIEKSNIPLYIIFIEIISILIFLTTFIVPVYSLVEFGETYKAVILNAYLLNDFDNSLLIYLGVNIFTLLILFITFINSLSEFISNKSNFVKKSKFFIILLFVLIFAFYITGLSNKMYFVIRYGMESSTVAYIPLLILTPFVVMHAYLRGKYLSYEEEVVIKERKYKRFETLIYIFLLSSITVLINLLPLIKIDVNSGSYVQNVNLTGLNILTDYGDLDQVYKVVAYVLVVILITTGLTLLLTLVSYISRSKNYNAIVKFTTIMNVTFVFLIGVSGYYFQIAKEINQAMIIDIANTIGVPIFNITDFDYTIGTDAIYGLIASLLIVIFMFFRKALENDDISLVNADSSLLNNDSVSDKIISDEVIEDFDPCYAFTELDANIEKYEEELTKRKALKVSDPTLNKLVNFVVDYAKNSRLHLSYTPQDIATFVAGLGAAKLSILQGMSGTGKTSLPKIFAEAIYSNIDIVEVESSWKDKNELLGYYNEFSLKYTPKKFTLALYKAALNQEVFTFVLLDEMNLSRIEYYFSDFLSLMEHEEDKREIKLVNIKLTRKAKEEEIEYQALDYGHTLKVAPNIWFIGTANRDESTFVISDKVYDRAHTMNFTARAPKVRDYSDPIEKSYYDYETINNLFETAKANGTFDAENNTLIKDIEKLLAPYNISFGNRILNQIEDFVNIYKECFPGEDTESEAVEKILLSKVVAKLEVKTIEDKEQLELEFKKLNLLECARFIKSLDDD